MPHTHTLPPSRHWPMHWLTGGEADGRRLAMAWLPGGTLRGVWAVPEHWQPGTDVPGDALRLSSLLGDPVGGGPMRLLLRARRDERIVAVVDALREASASSFAAHAATWAGSAAGLRWSARVTLATQGPLRWTWSVRVEHDAGHALDADAWDAILVQDLALASEAAARNNEKYVGQYLDLRLHDEPAGNATANPRLLARQGLPQPGGTHPALVAGAGHTAAIMTDLVAFFGTAFKHTHTPEHAHTPNLPHGVLQHETPAAILQSKPHAFDDDETFHYQFLADHPQATDTPAIQAIARSLGQADIEPWPTTTDGTARPASDPAPRTPVRSSAVPTDTQLADWLGPSESWRHVERDEAGRVLSFFHGPSQHGRHVATCTKDNTLRRGHGHILRTGQAFLPDDRSVCCTAYQHGVFASQLTVGNTTFGQLCSIARDPINLNSAAGLRLLVDLGDGEGFVQLAQAGAYEMAPGWCRWWYVLGERVVRISVAAWPDAPTLRYEVDVIEGGPLRFALRQHASVGEVEDGFATDVAWDARAGVVAVTPGDDGAAPWIARVFPGVVARWAFDDPQVVADFSATACGAYWRINTGPTARLGWNMSAMPDRPGTDDDPSHAALDPASHDFDQVSAAADAYWSALHRPVRASFAKVTDILADDGMGVFQVFDAAGAERLADAIPWMTHNAMIHLSVPHGLEQFGGAAWGTRDVCQGPTEFLRAIDRPDILKQVITTVFRHQDRTTGDWPQWFMHPPFHTVRAGDSHGDVVVWPLYALTHYLEMTGDASILDLEAGWYDAAHAAGHATLGEDAPGTIREHARRAIRCVVDRCIPGTALPAYGHGDWNDALQPADPTLAKRMVSCWTVALFCDTLQRLQRVLDPRRSPETDAVWKSYFPNLRIPADPSVALDVAWSDQLEALAERVREDFRRWCLFPDSHTGEPCPAGLVLFDEAFSTAEPLLHPADTRTGLAASLIVRNRATLADLPAPGRPTDLSHDPLFAPDGYRLMDRPPTYRGGVSTLFQRAESAAFFGREVGLMYTHAHLRYVETYIHAGDFDPALFFLNWVNPVGLTASTHTNNLAPRQANAYFSSSDARFATRYDADANYGKVRTGDIICDGGWRIYSSGPGIFLGLLRRAAESLR